MCIYMYMYVHTYIYVYGTVTGLAPSLTVDFRRIDVSGWVVLGEVDFDMDM